MNNWLKLSQSSYPYFIAIIKEGRLKGQYPPQIQFIPELKRKWDKGQLGSGTRLKEIKNTDARTLLRQVYDSGEDVRTVDYYIIEAPNSPRKKITYHQLINL